MQNSHQNAASILLPWGSLRLRGHAADCRELYCSPQLLGLFRCEHQAGPVQRQDAVLCHAFLIFAAVFCERHLQKKQVEAAGDENQRKRVKTCMRVRHGTLTTAVVAIPISQQRIQSSPYDLLPQEAGLLWILIWVWGNQLRVSLRREPEVRVDHISSGS